MTIQVKPGFVLCPRCEGKGSTFELDGGGDIWTQEYECWLCEGEGQLTQERLDKEWNEET